VRSGGRGGDGSGIRGGRGPVTPGVLGGGRGGHLGRVGRGGGPWTGQNRMRIQERALDLQSPQVCSPSGLYGQLPVWVGEQEVTVTSSVVVVV
jgi:hypothetical protein